MSGSTYIDSALNTIYYSQYNGEVVEVVTRIVNGVFTIVDAWVKS